jgi:flagellar biosynthetic protein FliR
MVLPMLGTASVPIRIRALLGVTMAMLILPLVWDSAIDAPGNLIDLTVLVAREATLGLLLGLALQIMASGMQMAGQVMSQMSGMSLAEVVDPNFDQSVPFVSHLLEMVALVIFFSIGGHRHLIASVLDSLEWMPVGRVIIPESIPLAIAQMMGQSFDLALRASSPVMVSLLLAIVIVALIGRTLPQLNSMAVGMNFSAIILLLVLAATLGGSMLVLEESQNNLRGEVESLFLDVQSRP